MKEPSHFKYRCRKCKREWQEQITAGSPEATPHPTCCGSRHNCAYLGVIYK